jgi:NADH-quinone oxidoreductase subunit D
MRGRLPEYDTLVRGNVIFQERCKGVGIISAETALEYGITGPCLRATGVPFDVRKAEPYGGYENFDFEVPVAQEADTFARFQVRLAELEQSLNIIEQAVRDIPDGLIMPKKSPRRFKPPAGEYYFAVESARGSYGQYIVSDGTDRPVKIKLRTPSFSNLSSMPEVLRGTLVADTIAILGSVDVVMPEVDR